MNSSRVPGLDMTWGGLLTRLALFIIVLVWTVPTFGLLISSVRDKDQLAVSGWWTSLQTVDRNIQTRTGTSDDMLEEEDNFVIRGNAFDDDLEHNVSRFGLSSGDPGEFAVGESAPVDDGGTITVQANGDYEWVSSEPIEEDRGKRIFMVESTPPRFTTENYDEVLNSGNIFQSFINTFTVTLPSTIIPIAIAAFAAYAFSWMEFWGRRWIFIIVVGLLVVPLQMSLIPLLRFYNQMGIANSYPGIWLAHTGFGLPLAIYLLYAYISGLPREIIESAKIDGATHFEIFVRLILPLSIPALVSFAIFQFLWVWNDLLVALVFLGTAPDKVVITSAIRELLGSRGQDWHILTAGAFVSMVVPLIVFVSLQRYFVRGLLAGSVKGG